jgi:hypothetical protein
MQLKILYAADQCTQFVAKILRPLFSKSLKVAGKTTHTVIDTIMRAICSFLCKNCPQRYKNPVYFRQHSMTNFSPWHYTVQYIMGWKCGRFGNTDASHLYTPRHSKPKLFVQMVSPLTCPIILILLILLWICACAVGQKPWDNFAFQCRRLKL